MFITIKNPVHSQQYIIARVNIDCVYMKFIALI